jgi:hypothetical protein
MEIKNMKSNKGNDVPNQFTLNDEFGQYFQSYSSLIVFERRDGKTFIGNDWDYSTTTGKYRNMFLGCDKKETLKVRRHR